MQKKTYVGIELGGSRRTAVLALDYFPAEHKAFVSTILPHLSESKTESADAALLCALKELAPLAIGVDAPLSLPPCLQCSLPRCVGFEHCEQPAVRWMQQQSKGRSYPPYAHRPIDLLLREEWKTAGGAPPEESFGAGRAPLAARMQYLKRHLSARLLEVHPRLALQNLASWYQLEARELRLARDLEEGVRARSSILAKLGAPPRSQKLPHLFLYNADLSTCAEELDAFDALLSALFALYQDLQLLEPPALDPSWGYVAKLEEAR